MEIKGMRYSKKPSINEAKSKKGKAKWYVLVFVFLLLASGGIYTRAALTKPLPSLVTASKIINFPATSPPAMQWPTGVLSAFGATNNGVIGSSGDEQPRSIASIAKIITALAVIQEKPISSTDENIITFSASDEALYHQYASSDGSYVPIHAGDQLSEYRALEAMLLPSANNMADSLAVWAFGSMEAYTAYANNMVKGYGLLKTTVGEASGFNDTTLSTPSDLIVLGQKLMANTWLAQIVGTQNDNLPVLGKLYNTNQLLGGGVIGIKTGHTNTAGYCLLLAKELSLDKAHSVTVLSAVMGAGSSTDSFTKSDGLVKSIEAGFGTVLLFQKGASLGTVITPWGSRSDIIAESDVNIYGWKYNASAASITSTSISSTATTGTLAGTVTAKNDAGHIDTYDLVLKDSLKPPSVLWRLTHYF
jgi:D-alanyl-D-alanine carboxypeptidase (penicillin-binding protein 5/6)